MSMQTKLSNAQAKGCGIERDRVMRICNHIIHNLGMDLKKKLMTSTDKHLADVKFSIASAVVGAIQLKVMTGTDPDAKAETSQIHRPDTDAVGPPQGDPDAAG